MAQFDTTLGRGATLRLEVNQSYQDAAGNFSHDDWALSLYRGTATSSWSATQRDWNVNINGYTWSGTFSFDFRSSEMVLIATGSTNITHNDDGTKSTACYASIENTGTVIGGGSTSGTLVQSNIGRGTQAVIVNNSSTTGVAQAIGISGAVAGYRHNVYARFGSGQYNIGSDVGSGNINWTPPHAMLTQIPNSSSGVGYVRVDTYASSGGAYVGTKDTPLTVYAGSDQVPTFTTVTNTEASPGIAAALGQYAKTLTSLNLAITGAAGIQGSSISSYKITVSGQTINARTGVSQLLTQSGTLAIVGTVTDSRGRSFSKSVNITVLNYNPPSIDASVFGAIRADSAGASAPETGDRIKVMLKASVTSLMNGTTQKNALSYKIYTKVRTATSYTLVVAQTPGGLTINNGILIGTYPLTTAYDVMVEVSDAFRVSTIVSQVAVASIFMHWAREGLGVGKFREQGSIDTLGKIYQNNGQEIEFAGMIVATARAATVPGWVICNGQAYLRTDYPTLFAAIGTAYGSPDATSFNVPNLLGRVIVGLNPSDASFDTRGEIGGSKTHTLAPGELPDYVAPNNADGNYTSLPTQAGSSYGTYYKNVGSAQPHNNLQPYMALTYLIKT